MHRIPPTLLLLAALGGGANHLAAATAGERDQHFAAVAGLIERDIRPSASRQLAEFLKAGYPDADLHQKALDWFYAEHFRTKITDGTEAARLEKKAKSLRPELDAAEKADTLPPVISDLLNGAGDPVTSIIGDLANFIHPDRPKPLVPPAPEKLELAKRQVAALIDAAGRGWIDGLVKIKANEAKEKTIFDFPEGDPKGQELLQEAIQLRLKALKKVYKAHLLLREVITRGGEFGLDGSAANAFFAKWTESNNKALADWDYSYGDYHPLLKLEINTLMLEGIRQKIKGLKQEEVESAMMAVVDIDLSHFPGSARDTVIEVQIDAWSALIRARLELGTPADLTKAQEFWTAFKDRNRNGNLRLDTTIYNRATALGRLWILAARVAQAKGDPAEATRLFGAVAAAKRNPASLHAQPWLAGNSGANVGAGWGEPVKPQDPAQALGIARTLIKEADSTANEKLRRSQTVTAATMLRAGVLGLADASPEVFVETAPALFNSYAVTLSKLELRYHAALAANEGLSQIAARLAADPKTNPWRTGTEWNAAGKSVLSLAKNSVNFVSQLASRTRGTQSLYDSTIDLVRKVSPETAGEDLELYQVSIKLDAGDLDGAMEAVKAFDKKYPESWIKVFSLMSSARMKKYDQMKEKGDKAGMKQLADDMAKSAEEFGKRIDAELAKPGITEDRQRDLNRARSTAASTRISLLIADERYADVLAELGPDYWKAPPADEALRGRMLRALCTAIQKQEFARIKDEAAKNDAAALAKLWPGFEAAYDTFRRVLPSIKDPDEQQRTARSGQTLGLLFQWVSSASEAYKAQPNAVPAMAGINLAAKKAMADLIEPTLTETSKPGTILGIAQTLWDIGEHARAVRLYELYQALPEPAANLKSFIDNPLAVLDPVEAAVGGRPEVKVAWAELRDLLYDKPGLADLIKQGAPEKEWGEKRISYGAAYGKLKAFRTLAETKAKDKLGADGWKAADKALKDLEAKVIAAVQDLSVRTRLAMGYRETGQKDKARALYDGLYAYDPDNGTFASAYVDIILESARAGTAKPEDLKKALDISKTIRNEAEQDLDLMWQATIQVYELSLALGNTAFVNGDLKFKAVNHSDPSHDLIAPAVRPDRVQKGDDPRARRARNALAGELAKRYLAIHEGAGVTEKPTFRIDTLSLANGQPLLVFTDVNAPTFELQTITNADDVEIQVLVETGKSAAKATEPAKTTEPAKPATPEGAKP